MNSIKLSAFLIVATALTIIALGEWLETRPNTLLDGWRMLGGGKGAKVGQNLSLMDLVVYAPNLCAIAGVVRSWPRVWHKFLGGMVILGGVCGAIYLVFAVLFAAYGMRGQGIGIMMILQGVFWLWREKTLCGAN